MGTETHATYGGRSGGLGERQSGIFHFLVGLAGWRRLMQMDGFFWVLVFVIGWILLKVSS